MTDFLNTGARFGALGLQAKQIGATPPYQKITTGDKIKGAVGGAMAGLSMVGAVGGMGGGAPTAPTTPDITPAMPSGNPVAMNTPQNTPGYHGDGLSNFSNSLTSIFG